MNDVISINDSINEVKEKLQSHAIEVSTMIYKMKVTIIDPNAKEGVESCLYFDLDCNFVYDSEQYGNGYYVSISGKGFYRQVIDLRYDKSFDRHNKVKWLEDWAKNYWSGENGSWIIKTLEIINVE